MSRIIAGSAGGTRLQTPTGDRTRPTTDRVREALFSSLATWNGSADAGVESQLAGLAFLDLFAGSGGVGLEAASRGASPVVLVEHDVATARMVVANAGKAHLQAQVETATVDSYLLRPGPRAWADVIWLDPPYPLGEEPLARTLELAMEHLLPNGLLVLERAKRSPFPFFPPGTDTWRKDYGETTVHYCQWSDPEQHQVAHQHHHVQQDEAAQQHDQHTDQQQEDQ